MNYNMYSYVQNKYCKMHEELPSCTIHQVSKHCKTSLTYAWEILFLRILKIGKQGLLAKKVTN